MPRLSNLPPGVTDAMIKEQAGGDDGPTIMSLKQVRETSARTALYFPSYLVADLCATVEELAKALKLMQITLCKVHCPTQWRTSDPQPHCPECQQATDLIGQLERKE